MAENGRRLRRLSGGSESTHSAAYNASVSQEQTSPGGLGQSSPPANSSRSVAAVTEPTPPPAVPLVSPPRLPLARGSSSSRLASPVRPSPQPSCGVETAGHKKVYLGGEEFDEIEPGVFTRSRHSLTRQSITQVCQHLITSKNINGMAWDRIIVNRQHLDADLQ